MMANPNSKSEMLKAGLHLTQRPMSGRKVPYTEIGIRRLRCARCDSPARQQWNICADNNTWRPICNKCDIALNNLVLKFFKFPNWKSLISAYIELHTEPDPRCNTCKHGNRVETDGETTYRCTICDNRHGLGNYDDGMVKLGYRDGSTEG